MGQVRKIKAGLVFHSDANDFVGEVGNLFFDISDGVLRLSDGATPGGIPLVSGGDSGGASTFRQLLDTPNSFSGAAGRFVKVNAQASALEFVEESLFDGNYNNLTNLPILFDPANITESLIPTVSESIDLGTLTKKWRDLYLSGNTIYLGDTVIRNVGGTVDLPLNAKVNGKKIPTDIRDLDDVDNLLGSSSFSGNYNDLTNKPDLTVYQLAASAFSGNYADLTNKPTIPTDISQLTDNNNVLAATGSGYSLPAASDTVLGGIKIGSGLTIDQNGIVSVSINTITSYNDLTDKPDLTVYQLASTAFSGSYTDLTNKPDLTVYQLASTAFSGSYTDLTNKPTIPVVPTTISSFSNDVGYITSYTVTQEDVTQYQSNIQITESQISDLKSYLTSVSFADLTSKPTTLSGYGITDAFSGSYNDLLDKPTLFDGNYSSLNGVPTNLSSFVNDVGFITSVSFIDISSKPTTLSGYGITDAFSGNYNDLINKPVIPTDISELTDVNNRLSSNITLDDLFTYSLIF